MFIDSHCHLEMESFDKDREEVIKRCIQEGLVYILTVGTEVRYFKKVIEILNKHPSIYGAIGIHPHNGKDYNNSLAEKIRPYLNHKKIVAYGEIGLDFFKNYSPRDSQIKAFTGQLELAKKASLPIIVHSRNAKEETLKILNEMYSNIIGGVIHCFSYDLDMAKKVLDMGFYISIPGTITYSNTQKLIDVVRYTPVDRLLAETDAPFLTPSPYRGKRNEPWFVKLTIEKIATIKHKKVEELALNLCDNFSRLFLKNLKGDKR